MFCDCPAGVPSCRGCYADTAGVRVANYYNTARIIPDDDSLFGSTQHFDLMTFAQTEIIVCLTCAYLTFPPSLAL